MYVVFLVDNSKSITTVAHYGDTRKDEDSKQNYLLKIVRQYKIAKSEIKC